MLEVLESVGENPDLGPYEADLENPDIVERWRGQIRHQVYETLCDVVAIVKRDVGRFSRRDDVIKTKRRRHANSILGEARQNIKTLVQSEKFLRWLTILGWEDPEGAVGKITNRFLKGYDMEFLEQMLDGYRSLKQGCAGRTRMKKENNHGEKEEGREPGAGTGADPG